MSILHHINSAIVAQSGIFVNAAVVDRLYLWNTELSKWNTFYFRVLPGYKDADDTTPVLPTTPNGGYAFVDTVDDPLEITYSASLISPTYIEDINYSPGSYWLKFKPNPISLYFYGAAAGNVPETIGDHVYTIRLFGTNSRNETVFQDFNITWRR